MTTIPFDRWGDTAVRYANIAITVDNQMVIYRVSDQAQAIIDTKEDNSNFLEAQRVLPTCRLLAVERTIQSGVQYKLNTYDPNGQKIREILRLDNPDSNKTFNLHPVLSPSGKYVSYVVYSGEQYYATAQYQDVEIVNVNSPGQPTRLTTHGGSWKEGGAWSPEGDQIAYTDYDAQGIVQVYRTDLIHRSTQLLSHFTTANQKAGPVQWSPTGEDIAVLLGNPEGGLKEAWIMSLTRKEMQQVNIPGQLTALGSTLLWSEKGDKLLIYGYADNESVRGLYWIDVANNRLIHTLTVDRASTINEQVMNIGFPYAMSADLSKVGFMNSDATLWMYSIPDQKIEALGELEVLKQGFIWDIRAFPEDLLSCQK